MKCAILLLFVVLSCVVDNGMAIQCYTCLDYEVSGSDWTSQCKNRRNTFDATETCSGQCTMSTYQYRYERRDYKFYERKCVDTIQPTGCRYNVGNVDELCTCGTNNCNSAALR